MLGNEYLEPMQRRNIRDYLNSIVLPGADANDMDFEKSNERDLECLIPNGNQSEEDDYIVGNPQGGLSDSFGEQSTASNSRMGRHNRRSIGEQEKNAIRRALDGVQTSDTNEEESWVADAAFNPRLDNTSDDYLMTGTVNLTFNRDAALAEQNAKLLSRPKKDT